MSLLTLINRECTLTLRSASVEFDEYGGEVPGETTVDTVCELQQLSRQEQAEAEISDTVWRVFFPAGTRVETGDILTVDGEIYEMVGDPWRARNPRTRSESHVEATARRVAGDEGGS